MPNIPKVAFVYESNHPIVVKDGLYSALQLLGDDYLIIRLNLLKNVIIDSSYDFVLGWGAFGSQTDYFCQRQRVKKGLCIAGNTHPPTGANNYNVLFYETKWYRPQIDFHDNIVQAFGYNSQAFSNLNIERDIDYLGVGAFARWKRWDKFLNKKGTRRVIGEFQQGNPGESQEIWDVLENDGVVCKDMVKPDLLNLEYNRAKTVYLPSSIIGGGERAVLEARACGCKVEVEPDNPKLQELLVSPLWTELDYAKKIKEGLQSCL